MSMVISKRLNLVQGRKATSWARVINGRLLLFIQNHSIVASQRQRETRTTHSLIVYEIEWEDFEELARVATFTRRHTGREGSTLRHAWRASH